MIQPTLALPVHRTVALFFNWTETIPTPLSVPVSLRAASGSDSDTISTVLLGVDPEVLLALTGAGERMPETHGTE